MTKQASILVSGATGLIGRALCKRLETAGETVRRLSRSGGDATWDPAKGELDPAVLDGVQCVVHLAGEPVAQRWTKASKQRILESRVQSTALLRARMLEQDQAPALVCASGINYYGYQCSGEVDETSEPGDGFLARVCREWEGAAEPLLKKGARTAFIRTGLVLSAHGGALARMLPVFKAGGGGRVGAGTQRMSWIGIDDLVAVYERAIHDEKLSGPVNAVAPAPVTNAEFARTLAQLLRRPAALPLPAMIVRALFGEMGRETLLADLDVRPKRLQELGFEWRNPDLESALKACLAPPGND
ncbi:MAG: TIGR01777 family oxidoreductase [Opitutales bacterium]